MIVNEQMLEQMFRECNREYFDHSLPMPRFVIIHRFFKYGQFSCMLDDNNMTYDEEIQISDVFDYTESNLRDIMVHEMIHYHLVFEGIDLKCSHGKRFKKMAKEFNALYGLNITPRIDPDRYQQRKDISFFKKLTYLFS